MSNLKIFERTINAFSYILIPVLLLICDFSFVVYQIWLLIKHYSHNINLGVFSVVITIL